MSPLSQGRIVWVTVSDPRGGNAKHRPAVIISPADEIDPGGEVLVAAITTQLGQSRFADTVELPSLPTGHPETKLKRPSEVVCSWVTSVAVAGLRDTGGFVPPDFLTEVLAKVARLS